LVEKVGQLGGKQCEQVWESCVDGFRWQFGGCCSTRGLLMKLNFVQHEQYSCRTIKWGEVVIRRNSQEPEMWDLLIGGKLVRRAYYRSAEDAAFFASRADFGDAYLNRFYTGFHVSADLENFWKHTSESRFVPVNYGN
jgi:hypothetical protein